MHGSSLICIDATNLTKHHDISEILLKLVLNTNQSMIETKTSRLYINGHSMINRLYLISRWVKQTQVYLWFSLRKSKRYYSYKGVGACYVLNPLLWWGSVWLIFLVLLCCIFCFVSLHPVSCLLCMSPWIVHSWLTLWVVCNIENNGWKTNIWSVYLDLSTEIFVYLRWHNARN